MISYVQISQKNVGNIFLFSLAHVQIHHKNLDILETWEHL